MEKYIGLIDYLVLISILLTSILIGVYHGFRDNIKYFIKRLLRRELASNENDECLKTNDYLTANSSMGLVPVAFSLLASFVSATSLLEALRKTGIPAEVYTYGIQYWMSIWGIIVTPIIGAFVTGPFFAKLKIFSVYEYLELRYKTKYVRLVGAGFYIIKAFISCSLFMYGPATALSTLTGLSEGFSIGLIGIIGTTYTSLGGIRGVIWTDLYQAIIMFGSLFMLIIKGLIDVGGFNNLLRINYEAGRLNFLDFNPSPFVRQNFWALVFGQIILFCNTYAIDQQTIQRFQAAKSKKYAQTALLLNIPGLFTIYILCHLLGLIIFALYGSCDPLSRPVNRLTNPNQFTGLFVMDSLSNIPGLAGLFLGSLFCGSLSSISSVLGSQSALVWEDLFKSFELFKNIGDKKSLVINKLIVLSCGVLSTGLAVLISFIGGNLVQVSSSLNGAFATPMIGLFFLSLFFPVVNVFGAIVATIAGFASVLWLGIGAIVVKPYYPGTKLNVSLESCPMIGNSTILQSFNYDNRQPLDGFNKIYSLSYLLYSAFGVVVIIIVGLITSLATGGYKNLSNERYIIFNLLGFIPKFKIQKSKTTKLNLENIDNETLLVKNDP